MSLVVQRVYFWKQIIASELQLLEATVTLVYLKQVIAAQLLFVQVLRFHDRVVQVARHVSEAKSFFRSFCRQESMSFAKKEVSAVEILFVRGHQEVRSAFLLFNRNAPILVMGTENILRHLFIASG